MSIGRVCVSGTGFEPNGSGAGPGFQAAGV